MKIIRKFGNEDHRPMNLRDAMQRMFEESVWDPFGWMGESFTRDFQPLQGFMPMIDVSENSKELLVEANIPGYDPKDIEIEVHDNVLSIHGVMQKDSEEGDKKYYRRERGYGEFRREILLPDYVDVTKAACKMKNGTLLITVSKKHSAPEHTRKIPIES